LLISGIYKLAARQGCLLVLPEALVKPDEPWFVSVAVWYVAVQLMEWRKLHVMMGAIMLGLILG